MAGFREALRQLAIPRWALWLLAGVIIFVLVVIFANVWPIGADYYYTFQPVAERWLRGETRLYDDNSQGFFNPPWTLVVLVPLSVLPLQWGEAILNVASLVGILASIYLLRGAKATPAFAVALAVGNLHTFDVLIRGQLDVLVLLGVALGWWAIHKHIPLLLSLSLLLMAVKPPNVILVTFLFLLAIRKWSLSDQAKAFSLPVLFLLASGFVIGFDWPLRYVNSYTGYYNQYTHLTITLWRGATQLGFPLWPLALLGIVALLGFLVLLARVGLNEWTLGIALATNLTFTLYAIGNHYVLLIPAFILVAREDWRLALLAYVTTWTPFLRLVYGYAASPIDVVYPVVLLAASWLFAARSMQQPVTGSAVGSQDTVDTSH